MMPRATEGTWIWMGDYRWFKSMKSMKRVDIKATAVLKGQGPKMLTEYYEYWKKHDTLFNYVI